MRKGFLIVLFVACTSTSLWAGTVLNFWHVYTPPLTGEPHYGFHLTDYKRGLFFGSCGISTRSLRWTYQFDLAGKREIYTPAQITLTTEVAMPVKIVSGRISVDAKQAKAEIALQIEQGGVTNAFVGNGTYSIIKLE